jgi:hypothetical protein
MAEQNYSEYIFQEYYRVVKAGSDGKYLLSVDVYRGKYPFQPDEKICVKGESDCILYTHLKPDDSIPGVKDIIVTGVKTGDIMETINVRWILDHDPDYEEIEKIFYESWKIIGCKGPKDDPWHVGCPESTNNRIR